MLANGAIVDVSGDFGKSYIGKKCMMHLTNISTF
jgi:hypothetical protein